MNTKLTFNNSKLTFNDSKLTFNAVDEGEYYITATPSIGQYTYDNSFTIVFNVYNTTPSDKTQYVDITYSGADVNQPISWNAQLDAYNTGENETIVSFIFPSRYFTEDGTKSIHLSYTGYEEYEEDVDLIIWEGVGIIDPNSVVPNTLFGYNVGGNNYSMICQTNVKNIGYEYINTNEYYTQVVILGVVGPIWDYRNGTKDAINPNDVPPSVVQPVGIIPNLFTIGLTGNPGDLVVIQYRTDLYLGDNNIGSTGQHQTNFLM